MSSMLYTMGTALTRAAESGLPVSVLVEGHWVDGRVAAHDGMGVVLEAADGQHCVVRTERISVVRIDAASPYGTSPSSDPSAADSPISLPGGPRMTSRVGEAA